VSSAQAVAAEPRSSRATLLPQGSDRVVLAMVAAALALLYLPTYADLAGTVWQNSDQSQGPLMLLASLWLLFDKRHQIAALPSRPNPIVGAGLLGFGLLMYVIGRSQSVWLLEVGSQIPVFAALLLLFKGAAALRTAWFAIFFLIFMVPLPGPLVAAVTGPLKSAVSLVASELLHFMDLPVSRSGVILTVGPYLILVADACAGLTSMFSLEAVGLLYLNIVRHPSALRNVLLSVLVIPIAFCANVIRVLVLVLVTLYLGDSAGRGFLHSFAGLLLFMVAIVLIVAVDQVLGLVMRQRSAA